MMNNEIIFFLEMIIVFSLVVISQRAFGKLGLFAWLSIATITANLGTLKSVHMFGVTATLGQVMFASNFLATDILTELYGVDEAKRGVLLNFFCSAAFLICTQITLFYQASRIDFADPYLKQILSVNMRITCSSLLMLLVANIADVIIYEKLRINGARLWFRNNVSTIICNCLENFGFVFLAFYGIYDFSQCIEIALSISFIEVITSLCDTPFLYAALR